MRFQELVRKAKQGFTLILAGLTICGFLMVAFISLAAGDNWIKKADMAAVRGGHAASVVGDKVYIIGGFDETDILSTVEVYDPVKDKFTKKADMPTARFALSTSVVKGKIYAIGGGDDNKAHSVVEEYNPATDKWTKKANMPTPRWLLSTSVVNGRIYAIGGCSIVNAAGPALSTVEVYDPVTDKWTKKADMPTARMGLSSGVVDGKVYAIGGQPAAIWVWWNALSTVEVYDPATDKWMKKAGMPTPRTQLPSSAPVINDKIYVIGGAPNFRASFSTVEVYNPATDKWVKKADMPTARMYLSTSSVNGKIYAIGGWSGDIELATVEEYTPEGWPFPVSSQDVLKATWGKIKRGI